MTATRASVLRRTVVLAGLVLAHPWAAPVAASEGAPPAAGHATIGTAKWSGLTVRCRPSQVEVGGPFAGVELHSSSLEPRRISLFYPVANSIDVSEDYWRRHERSVLAMAVKVGSGPRQMLATAPCDCLLTPFSAAVKMRDDRVAITATYRFPKTLPGLVLTIQVTNRSRDRQPFELFTHLEASVRTCHTYTPREKAWTEADAGGAVLYTNFEEEDTGKAQIFVANAGERPASFTTRSDVATAYAKGERALGGEVIDRRRPDRPAAAFVYRKELAPARTMTIVQIIGSAKAGEARSIAQNAVSGHASDVVAYEEQVMRKVTEGGEIATGDATLDRSAVWARAVLAVNAHHLDGEVVPMPCPSQYNFWFVHDTLMTDVAAANLDLERVGRDLRHIAKRTGQGHALPHAYYWKDGRYQTELVGDDNWNHLWANIVTARYVRHGGATAIAKTLYPVLVRSIGRILANERDGTICADRPDWWDCGKSHGPRAYLTILTIRALRELAYLATVLGCDTPLALERYEEAASRLERGLRGRLWDDRRKYLINVLADGSRDTHIYIGSLLAGHFGLLSGDQTADLVATARARLLEPRTGIYNAVPMDFHRLEKALVLLPGEEGAPFHYLNGGIWAHGNAWYALALLAASKETEALDFVRTVMALDGVHAGPNGQPAMYECRNGNPGDPSEWGKVDKPQFLWAAGWYLYTLLSLCGLRENPWNLSISPRLPDGLENVDYPLVVGGSFVKVSVRGSGSHMGRLTIDGQAYPSAVLPLEPRTLSHIVVERGLPTGTYLASTDAMLVGAKVARDGSGLTCLLRAFPGHRNRTRVVSRGRPRAVLLDGEALPDPRVERMADGAYETEVVFRHPAAESKLVVAF